MLGRVCKPGPGRGYTGLSPMSRTTRLAEEPANRLRDRTKAGPLQQSRTLQTRPSELGRIKPAIREGKRQCRHIGSEGFSGYGQHLVWFGLCLAGIFPTTILKLQDILYFL